MVEKKLKKPNGGEREEITPEQEADYLTGLRLVVEQRKIKSFAIVMEQRYIIEDNEDTVGGNTNLLPIQCDTLEECQILASNLNENMPNNPTLVQYYVLSCVSEEQFLDMPIQAREGYYNLDNPLFFNGALKLKNDYASVLTIVRNKNYKLMTIKDPKEYEMNLPLLINIGTEKGVI